MTFEDLLKFEEDHPELFEFFACNNQLMLWPIIRFFVHQKAVNQIYNLCESYSQKEKLKIKNIIIYLFLTLIRNPFFSKPKPIAIFSSNVVNMLENGIYINRLYDYFVRENKKNINMYEDSFRKKYRTPRKEKVYYSDILYIIPKILGLFSKINKKDGEEINKFIELLVQFYPVKFDTNFYNKLRKNLINACKKFWGYKLVLFLFVKLKKVGIVIREDASYGHDNAIIMRILNKLGVVTVEMQHGLVALEHPAYNYPESVITRKNNYYEHLPQYFLTFGEYWNKLVRLPAKIQIIGFPYLLEKVKCNNIKSENILVISDGNIPEIILKLCFKLSNAFQNKKIILKLHPIEVPLVNKRYSLLKGTNNIEIKTYEPVYKLLKESKFIVGFISTVMIEALAFDIIPFVFDNELSRKIFVNIPFNYWKDFDELINMIKSYNNFNNKIDKEYFFASNTSQRFMNFLKSLNI
jgi:hypothetical protein